ncbi:MAG TPA: hypothetical protein VGH49_06290 [Xanthobacteraceae bacterium]
MTAMISARALGLALAILAIGTAAHAQTMPWPTDAPKAPGQAPWPGSAQPGQPAQPMAMPVPGAPMMGGGGGGGAGPTPEQLQCLKEFTSYREEVEKRAMTAKAASEKKPTREEMCQLVTLYSTAEAKWIKYSETNMAKCGIPKQAIEQIKSVHVHTADVRKKLCSAGPAGAAPAAPSLSDALGTASLPVQETEKPKTGGMLDTMTGNALSK